MKTNIKFLMQAAPILLLLLSGCAQGPMGLQVVRPRMVGHPGGITGLITVPIYSGPTTVESLKPVLEWMPAPENGIKYDVIVYIGIKKSFIWVAGKEVYYREGLTTTTHTVEESLSPQTVYVWSVRKRSGTNVSPWSTFSDKWGETRRENVLYSFTTPNQ